MSYIPNIHFFKDNFDDSFIFARRAPSFAGAEAEEENPEAAIRARETEAASQRLKEELQEQVTRARMSEETKQLMRECLASDSLERHNLVEEFLRQEHPNEEEFSKRLDALEHDEKSWSAIFTIQREIRGKIQELQWRAASYVEIAPRTKRRVYFENLLGNARALNRQDDATDKSLKQLLQNLMTPQTEQGATAPAAIDKAATNELYSIDPLSPGLERTLKKYQSKIENAAGRNGKALFKKLLALKKEEARIEAQFLKYYNDLERLVRENLSQARRKADEEKVLKEDSRLIGITLKEGTEIEFQDPGILSLISSKKRTKIKRIVFEDVPPVRDHKGRIIDRRVGIPIIYIDNAKMPIGRFKKWVDAVDAVEAISDIAAIERATDLESYGIKIKPGMTLSYPRRKKEGEKIETQMAAVTIREIDAGNKKIYFSERVPYQPGFETGQDYDTRDWLSFSEFVKWWHRYEVEVSVSLEDLREHLKKWNEIENKRFGIGIEENPPISLDPNSLEDLYYPDEEGTSYKISAVTPESVTLDGLGKKSLPEFWYWVKNNHVRKRSRKISAKEQAAEEARKADIEEARSAEAERHAEKLHFEEERKLAAEKHKEEKYAGTITDRLKEIWWTTNILSLMDLWNMTKEIVEFVKRKHQRRSKGRYGEAGSRLPWVLGTEFERVKQAAENEEVHKYEEAMKQWSVFKVKETLYATTSKDEAKACIMTLVHHGEMRWDDHNVWRTLNRLSARYTMRGAELYIPEDPSLIPPGKSGEDMTEFPVNALWGEGQWAQWVQENISKYNSNKNNYEYIFKQLENDPKGTGGPAAECDRLLRLWREGKYVNPQHYEEILDAAIKYGKMNAEQKFFYLIAGILTRQGDYPPGKHPHGETLLHLDRLGELNSKYTNNLPLIDFFTTFHVEYTVIDPETGKTIKKKRKPNQLSDYERWMRDYFYDDYMAGKPGPGFSRFMWEVMMTNEEVRTRMSKGIRNAENMDHDDAHMNISTLTPTEIDNVTAGPTGQKKYFTNEGYMNGYGGFNQFILSLSYSIEEEYDEEKKKNKTYALRDAVNAFIRYDGILDNRLLRNEGDRRARLDDRHYRRHIVVDSSCLLGKHQSQLRNLMVSIGRAYGEDWSWLYKDKFGLDPEGQKQQELYERRVNELKDKINLLFERDNGQRAMDVIKQARDKDENDNNALRGIKGSRRPPPEVVAAMTRRAAALEHQAETAHGGHH